MKNFWSARIVTENIVRMIQTLNGMTSFVVLPVNSDIEYEQF